MDAIELLLVTALFICSLSIFILYKNDYPCTVSGCGCSDIWEMLGDTWSGWQLFIAVILYGGYLYHKYL